MNCEKCQGVGFIEHNAGLLTEFCDCGIGKEIFAKKRAIYGIPEEIDGNSGTEPDNTDTGSPDTSQSEKPKRRKTKKKARKRAS